MRLIVFLLTWVCVPTAFAAGIAVQGYFGAQLGPADAGVVIVAALPESPAARAGLRAGDVLVEVDGERPAGPTELAAYLREAGSGAKVRVNYLRSAAEHEIDVRLTANPWQDADQMDAADGLLAVRELADLAYRDGDAADAERHRLDLYLPETDRNVPALLWIHGGGWSLGGKENERNLALRFAERGVAVAVMNYRLSAASWADPELSDTGVTHPSHINDVADAFVWLARAADRYGLDSDGLFVGGHSAGGHLAALLASDARYLQARELPLNAVAGALPIGGAYDIEDYHAALVEGDPELGKAHIHAVFGRDRGNWQDASPTRYLGTSDVPMLVVVEDQAGFQRYARRLAEAASDAERTNIEFFDAVGRTHGNVILLMTGRHEDSVRARMLEFIGASAS